MDFSRGKETFDEKEACLEGKLPPVQEEFRPAVPGAAGAAGGAAAAIGGAAALMARCVESAEVIAFDELGTEAIRKLKVNELPVIVVIDSEGNNSYELGREKYAVTE